MNEYLEQFFMPYCSEGRRNYIFSNTMKLHIPYTAYINPIKTCRILNIPSEDHTHHVFWIQTSTIFISGKLTVIP
jgi:hypothetical protein